MLLFAVLNDHIEKICNVSHDQLLITISSPIILESPGYPVQYPAIQEECIAQFSLNETATSFHIEVRLTV